MTKRSIIAGLAGINLLVLGLLVAATYSMPSAMAQRRGGGGGGGYACVTAKVAGQSYDVVYLLTGGDQLHALYPTSIQAKNLSASKPRDLNEDFERNRKP